MPKLPNITRDDILRSASEVRLPDVDLPMPRIDVGKAVAGAAAAAGLRSERPRRWPRAVGGLILAALAGWAISSNEAGRARLANLVSAARERVSAIRSGRHEPLDAPIAFQAAETAPIKDSPFTDRPADAIDYPAGLGSDDGDAALALEETGSPAG